MNQHEQDLKHIREMMEKSSRFISLSGISGIFAGVTALIASGIVYLMMQSYQIDYLAPRRSYPLELIIELMVVAAVTLIIAIGGGIFFTYQKSKKVKQPIWNTTSKNIIKNSGLVLVTGGLFCLILLFHQIYYLIAPCTLIFYGLSLVIGSQYTYGDVKYLGICEIVLGLTASIFTGYGLVFWALGFGILHIVYGFIMHKKYQ